MSSALTPYTPPVDLSGYAQNYIKGAANVDLTGSMLALTTGAGNFTSGNYALGTLTTGSYNVAIGNSAGYSCATGSDNTFIGAGSGISWLNPAGARTVAIGKNASTYENETVAIGYNSDTLAGHTGSVALGAGTQTNAADQVAVGARDLEIQANGTRGLVLRSPSGTRYRVTVSDAGALVVAPA